MLMDSFQWELKVKKVMSWETKAGRYDAFTSDACYDVYRAEHEVLANKVHYLENKLKIMRTELNKKNKELEREGGLF